MDKKTLETAAELLECLEDLRSGHEPHTIWAAVRRIEMREGSMVIRNTIQKIGTMLAEDEGGGDQECT